MKGDRSKAESFGKIILGAPPPPLNTGAPAARIEMIEQMQVDARRSVVGKIIGDIAADKKIDNGLRQVKNSCMEDGGKKWAASLAVGPERGALLDLVRIEATNIVAAALGVRKTIREEFAPATFALTYTDRRFHTDIGKSPPFRGQ